MLEEFMEKVLVKLDKQEEFSQKVLEKLDENEKNFKNIFAKLEEHDRKFDMVFAKLEEHDKKFQEIDKQFEIVNQKFEVVNQKFAKVDEQFADMNKEIKGIKNYIIIIEDKLSNEIPALFDGYNSNFEKNTNLESRQDVTEQKVAINSLRISSLEDTSKKHSKQISKLLTQ